jgi:hypothetical protein
VAVDEAEARDAREECRGHRGGTAYFGEIGEGGWRGVAGGSHVNMRGLPPLTLDYAYSLGIKSP